MRSEIEFRLLMFRLAVKGDHAINAMKWPLAALLLACAFALGVAALG